MLDATNGCTDKTAARIGVISLLALAGLLVVSSSAAAQAAVGLYPTHVEHRLFDDAGNETCHDDNGSLRFEAAWSLDTLEVTWNTRCTFWSTMVGTPATMDCDGEPGNFECTSTLSRFEFQYSWGNVEVIYGTGSGGTGYLSAWG